MYYSNYNNSSRFKELVPGILLVIVLVLGIGWMIAEFACTRTFVGTVVSKDSTITFSHDERETHIRTDKEGNVKVTHSGTDETIAYKKYIVTFYCEGKMREITTGTSRGRVPYVRADAAALQALAMNDTEPPHYTYAKMNTEYLVKVSGWLLDGSIEDMTPMSSIKAEAP